MRYQLCLYKGFWQHLPFISSVFVFRKKAKTNFFTAWLSLAKCAEMKSCMVGSHFPPHCSSLHPRGAHYTTACSETSHSSQLHRRFSGPAYLLMTISSLSLNFRVQITQKGWGWQFSICSILVAFLVLPTSQINVPLAWLCHIIKERLSWGAGKSEESEMMKTMKAKL